MKKEKSAKKNKLPESVVEELDAMDEQALQKQVTDSTQAISTAKKERDENENYQAAKLAVSDLSAGLKEVKAYQGAKIAHCLARLTELKG